MTTLGQYPGDQHSVTADELLAAMIADACDGRELEVAAALENLAAKVTGARMEILARAAAAAAKGGSHLVADFEAR